MSEDVKPWDMINGSPRVSDDLAAMRYTICKGCEFFRPITKRCAECGCAKNRRQRRIPSDSV